MRSKCRCSCVLQFTFRRAVSCVLHRPPSQVIHCTVLCFKHCSASAPGIVKRLDYWTSHHWGGQQSNSSFESFPWRRNLRGLRHTKEELEPPASQGNSVSLSRTWCKVESRQTGPTPELPSTRERRSEIPIKFF